MYRSRKCRQRTGQVAKVYGSRKGKSRKDQHPFQVTWQSHEIDVVGNHYDKHNNKFKCIKINGRINVANKVQKKEDGNLPLNCQLVGFVLSFFQNKKIRIYQWFCWSWSLRRLNLKYRQLATMNLLTDKFLFFLTQRYI